MAYRCRTETTVAASESRSRRLIFGLLTSLAMVLAGKPASAQFGSPPSDLSDAVQVDEASSAARTLLERAKAHAAEKQWDEAIETLRQVMEHDGGKLIRLDPRHFITVREYCQLRLAELAPEGRALYRSRVDSLAKRWYQQGIADRDAKLLGRVVDQFFVSSWGDAALMALGEIALERGDYQEARWCWERISPELREPDGQPLWLRLQISQKEGNEPRKNGDNPASAKKSSPQSPRWLAYPDTKLNLADVRARLVLVSIMENSLVRAHVELADFIRCDPSATGHMAGRDALYAETLSRLLTGAEARPPAPPRKDWTTFAGSPERTAIAAEPRSLGNLLWEVPLGDGKPFQADISLLRRYWPMSRVAEDQLALLSFHPLVVGNLVLYNTVDKVFALDLRTGKPAWPIESGPNSEMVGHEPGEIYCGTRDQDKQTDLIGDGNLLRALGAPRFTMSVVGNRLYARLGSPITGHPPTEGSSGGDSNYLVCLDLAAQGLLVWRVPGGKPLDERWSYEGAPVADGNNVYVAMRYSDVRPQLHVACLDARTGALRWRRLVCAAESLAQGQADEITSDLLTLSNNTLYLNTNLGAIAALSAADGDIRWISTYPRAKKPTREDAGIGANFYRDLNPCVCYQGSLFVAPCDTPGILALDASTGGLLWESHFAELRQTAHLLGVASGNLIATGRKIWWFDVASGKTTGYWQDQTSGGYGRGALVGEQVYWPMRTQIRRCKQRILPDGKLDDDEPIQLDRFDPPLTGGNLIAANGYLLIATPTRLIAFGPGQPATTPDDHILTQSTVIPADKTTRHR